MEVKEVIKGEFKGSKIYFRGHLEKTKLKKQNCITRFYKRLKNSKKNS